MIDIEIETETIDEETVKVAYVSINGKQLREYFVYPSNTNNADIISDVQSKLVERGYTW